MAKIDKPLDAASVAREFATLVAERCAKDQLEFRTFCLGLRFEDLELAKDGRLEPFRSSVKKLASLALAEPWRGLDRLPDLSRPEATFVFEPKTGRLEVHTKAIYLYGRYRKLERGLPQTRWHCFACHGQGCRRCRRSGREHPSSVEERIGDPVARALRASGLPLLHGMGREDADVRMLGAGRPFVLEVVSPRRRRVDLAALAPIAGVELAVPLVEVTGELVARVKQLDPDKRYRALCRAERDLDPPRIELLASLAGREVQQRTPRRVKSRADRVRARRIIELKARSVSAREVELEIAAESGTYIKEFVSGDEGRTEPSIASLLGAPIAVTELDVLDVQVEDGVILSGH